MTTGDIPDISDGAVAPRPAAGAARKYAAFISYSHVDEAAAKLLHRRLETYRLPPNVRDAPDIKRIGTIFRDRADLAAATDLSDSIKAALAESAALVVLCSPEAKQSQWVDAEIRLFRELHPAAPILAVVLRGEPSETMPLALVEDGREPLAADFRKEGDGAKLGFLKVVAALKALPLDSLIQRDAQRRLRRVIIITVVAVALLLAMAGMTAYAISARNEAQRQRAEAEGLVEFMLTDLRTRLRGVGRIDVMSAVNDRAMAYYDNQGDLSGLSDDSLQQRVRVLQAMGEDDFRRDNVERATRLFSQAYASTEAALERNPDNPDRIFAHAQSEFWMGEAARVRGDAAGRERHWRTYARLADRLMQVSPDLRAIREVGYARGNLCTLSLRKDDALEEAEQYCRAALIAQRRVLAHDASDRQASVDVTNRLSWLAIALARRNKTDEARGLSDEALANARRIVAADPTNKDSQDLLFATLLSRSRVMAFADRRGEAITALDEAQAIVDSLQSVDPANERWRRLASSVETERAALAVN